MRLHTVLSLVIAMMALPSLAIANGRNSAGEISKLKPCSNSAAGRAASTCGLGRVRNKSNAVMTVERGVRVWRMVATPQQQLVYAPAAQPAADDDTGTSGSNSNSGTAASGGYFGGDTFSDAVPTYGRSFGPSAGKFGPSIGRGTGSGLGGLGTQPLGQVSTQPTFGAPLRASKFRVGYIAPGRPAKHGVTVRGGFDRPRFGGPGFGPGLRRGGNTIAIRANVGPRMGIGGPRMIVGPRMAGPRMMGGGPRVGRPRMMGGGRGGGVR